MNTQRWITHFEQNAVITRRITLPEAACALPEEIRAPLARSIAIFQLGESGGGTRLRRYARKVAPLEQFRGYMRAMDLFVAEEQGHAALLARLLDHLGGTRLRKQWTNSVFRTLRVLANMEFNIQVLLTAELIAEVYFGSLYLRVDDPAVRLVARKLLSDEMKHLAFQRDFLAERLAALSPAMRRLWRLQFLAVHHVTAWVVSRDHASCFRALGLRPGDFRRRATAAIGRFSARLWRQTEAAAGAAGGAVTNSAQTSGFPARSR